MYRRRLLEKTKEKSEKVSRSEPCSPSDSLVISSHSSLLRRQLSGRLIEAHQAHAARQECSSKLRTTFQDTPEVALISPSFSLAISSTGSQKGVQRPEIHPRSPAMRQKRVSEDASAVVDSNDTDKELADKACQKDASVGRRQQRRMLHELHRCMARSGVLAVAASASALSRGMDQVAKLDEVSKFRGRSRSRCERRTGRLEDETDEDSSRPPFGGRLRRAASAVARCARTSAVGIAARLSAQIQILAESIGEPPRRGTATNEETPLELLWAVNLLVLSILGSVLLVVMAFVSQSWWAEDEESLMIAEMLVTGDIHDAAAAASGPVRLSIRIFSVAAVSFLSGICLRIIHPLQSALICGV